MIKNNKYPKTLQKAVDVMRKVKFKAENNNDKNNTQNLIKMEVVKKINQMRRVFHQHIHIKIAIAVVQELTC